VPAKTLLLSQLIGSALFTGQPWAYTAAAVWTVRATWEVRVPHMIAEYPAKLNGAMILAAAKKVMLR